MLKYILLTLSIFCLCSATDLMAPETTERDVFGFESYRVEESGAIRDGNGAIKGWIVDTTIYDSQWNVRYTIHEGRPRKGEDVKG